tara:strand:- start:10440 stop:10715 length:276 start_codon:yes stop_codon:yes gene_type:complete
MHYAIHWPAEPGGETTHRARYLGEFDTAAQAVAAAGHTVSDPLVTVFRDNSGDARSWVAEAPSWMTDEDHLERRAGDWLAAGPALEVEWDA